MIHIFFVYELVNKIYIFVYSKVLDINTNEMFKKNNNNNKDKKKYEIRKYIK